MATRIFLEQLERTCKEFVDEFAKEVKVFGLSARYGVGVGGKDFYIDYSTIYRNYTKADSKKALEIFKKFSDIITLMCDTYNLTSDTPIAYEVDKTPVSSARIGKCLYVFNLPFSLKDEYYCSDERR